MEAKHFMLLVKPLKTEDYDLTQITVICLIYPLFFFFFFCLIEDLLLNVAYKH